MAKQKVEQPAKVATVRVANQHSATIMFTRRGGGGVALPPLILPPGRVTEVVAEEWKARKQSRVVQNYLDRGLLAEVRKAPGSEVPVLESTTADLPIPEHLQTAEEGEQTGTVARVRVKRKRPGTVDV